MDEDKTTVNRFSTASKKPTMPKWRPPKISGDKVRIFGVAFLVLVSTSAGFVGGWLGAESHDNDATIQEKKEVISSESDVISALAKEVGQSVVSINVTSQEPVTDFFGNSRNVAQASAGTGIIISTDGVVMTNRHVVESDSSDVSVTLSDGTELDDVSIIGRTSENDSLDVAFLKINDKKDKSLKAAKLGDSSKMEVGDKVIAIGNALGQFQNTVTEGIISGYGRSVEAGDSSGSETLQNLFQTDAAINQGNSGGPLVNLNGEVIGLNTAIAGNAQNIGFAIPINDIQGLVKSVLEKGKLERPYLGIRYVSLTDDLAYQYNLSLKRGAYIVPGDGQSSVVDDSPASKAGLKEKDIIIKINDTAIDETHSLTSVLGQSSVGDKVKLTVSRDGKEQVIEVTLEAAPQG
jgi:S1-C subfamily serine protease